MTWPSATIRTRDSLFLATAAGSSRCRLSELMKKVARTPTWAWLIVHFTLHPSKITLDDGVPISPNNGSFLMAMYLLQSIKNIRSALVWAVVKSHVDVASRRNLRNHAADQDCPPSCQSLFRTLTPPCAWPAPQGISCSRHFLGNRTRS